MTIISQSYVTLKKETGEEFARKTLLENLRLNNNNIKKTAAEMQCSRNTIYLALKKEEENNLSDNPPIPKSTHPNTTNREIIDLIVKRRKETGFGKRRLKWYIVARDNYLIPESTISKILKKKNLARRKKRVRREYHRIKYQWDKILPFEQVEMDTKEIADKDTFPLEIYNYIKDSDFLPKWQWSIVDPVTRIRFLAWSYSRDWSCGQVFGKMIVWWLRLFGFTQKIINWSGSGTEFNSSQLGAFERTCQNFWKPLGVERKIIRKGHSEDNPFVERFHQTDDYEFYIPYLLRAKSELDFIKLGTWWQKVYNTIRTNMGIGDLTPYQKLRSLGYPISEKFCLFPTLILDRLVSLKEVLNHSKSVQEHLNYDH